MKPIFDKLEKQEQREKIFIPRGSSFNWKIFLNVRRIPTTPIKDFFNQQCINQFWIHRETNHSRKPPSMNEPVLSQAAHTAKHPFLKFGFSFCSSQIEGPFEGNSTDKEK